MFLGQILDWDRLSRPAKKSYPQYVIELQNISEILTLRNKLDTNTVLLEKETTLEW